MLAIWAAGDRWDQHFMEHLMDSPGCMMKLWEIPDVTRSSTNRLAASCARSGWSGLVKQLAQVENKLIIGFSSCERTVGARPAGEETCSS